MRLKRNQTAGRRPSRPVNRRFRPTLECLEARDLPSGSPPVVLTPLPDMVDSHSGQLGLGIQVQDNQPASNLQWQADFGTTAYLVDHQLGLVNTQNYHTLWSGSLNAKWIRDDQGNWYYLLKNGELHKWELGSGHRHPTGALVANLDPLYYVKPAWLTAAANATDPLHYQKALDMAFVLDSAFNLQDPNAAGIGGVWENRGGRNARWLKGTDFQNHAAWFFILPDGSFYKWNGQPGAYGRLLARLDPMYYQMDMLRVLANSGGLPAPTPPAVTVGFAAAQTNSYGNTLTIAPTQYRGTLAFQAQIDNGIGTGYSRIFQVTFLDHAPVLNVKRIVNVTKGATHFKLTATDQDPGDSSHLSFNIGFATDILSEPFLQLPSGTDLKPLTFLPAMNNWGGAWSRWFRDPTGRKYFLDRSGDLFLYGGRGHATGTYLGMLPMGYVYNPYLLQLDTHQHIPTGAQISVDNSGAVTVTMPAGYKGRRFAIVAAVSDGLTTTSRRIVIVVQ